jgi:hypothetical protein
MSPSAADAPRCAGSSAAPGLISAREEVLSAFEALRDALELGDVDGLEALLDAAFTTRHLTGDEQPRADWLADLDAGRAEHHTIDVVETSVRPLGERAVLTVRTLTDATLFRLHAVWRMQHRIDYERRDGTWIAMRMVTRSW